MRNRLAPFAHQRAIYSGRIDRWEEYEGQVRACFRNVTVWPGVRQDQTWAEIKNNSISFDHLWIFNDKGNANTSFMKGSFFALEGSEVTHNIIGLLIVVVAFIQSTVV